MQRTGIANAAACRTATSSSSAARSHVLQYGTETRCTAYFCCMQDCDLYVIDFCGQVTIDECTNCRIFIGPTEGRCVYGVDGRFVLEKGTGGHTRR